MSAPSAASIAIHSVPEPTALPAPPRESSEEPPFESLLEPPSDLASPQQAEEDAPIAPQALESDAAAKSADDPLADDVALTLVEDDEMLAELDSIVLSVRFSRKAELASLSDEEAFQEHQPEVAEDVVAQSLAGLSIIVPSGDLPDANRPMIAVDGTAETNAPEIIGAIASRAEPATQAPRLPLPPAAANPAAINPAVINPAAANPLANPAASAQPDAGVQTAEKLDDALQPAPVAGAQVAVEPPIESITDLPPANSARPAEENRIPLPRPGHAPQQLEVTPASHAVQQQEEDVVALPAASAPAPPEITHFANEATTLTQQKQIENAATLSTTSLTGEFPAPGNEAAPEVDVPRHKTEPAAKQETADPLAGQNGNEPSAVNLPEGTINNSPSGPAPVIVEQAAPVASSSTTATSTAAQSPLAPSSGSVEFLFGGTQGPQRADRHAAVEIDTVRLLTRVARAFTAAQQRDGEIRLRLSPPELGTLQIQVRVHEGALTARLEAETSTARTALIDNLPALRERLAEQGVRVERFDVDLMQRQAGGAPDRRGDQPGDPQPVVRGAQAVRSRPEQGPALRPILVPADSTGRLNVII